MRAKFSSVSVSGIAEARPGVLVSTTDWASPGKVSSVSKAAAAAKARHARCYRDRDLFRPQTAKLFTHCRPDRQITRMQAGHILAGISGGFAFSNDCIQIQRGCIDDTRARRTVAENLFRNKRARIQTDRTAGDQIRPRKVSRSAAPGPAPIKCTVICVLLQPRHKQPARHLRFALYIPVWQG